MPGVCFLCVVVFACVSSLGFRKVHEDPVTLRKHTFPPLYADQDLKPCCSWVQRCFILLTFVAGLGCMILVVVSISPPLLSSAKDMPRCILLNCVVKLRFVTSFNETPSHCQRRWDCSLPGSERVSADQWAQCEHAHLLYFLLKHNAHLLHLISLFSPYLC